MKSKEELKKLFENGDKPTQEEFWEWQDSYWHKGEKLPTEAAGIYKIKGSVANLVALNALTGMEEGDVYNLLDNGDNYVYVFNLNNTDVAGWDKLSGIINLSDINLQTVLNNDGYANSDYSEIALDMINKTAYFDFRSDIDVAKRSSMIHNENGTYFSQIHSLGTTNLNIENSSNSISFSISDGITSNHLGLIVDANSALTYLNDYSSRFTNRSLVDKGYVNSAISDVIRNLGSINLVNTNTIYSSSSDLNNDYPDVKLGFEVYSTSSGHIHKKITDTSWSISEVNLLP